MNRSRHILVAALLAALAAGPIGCPTVGWFATAFAPPKKTQALYELPKGKTILVFVDDYYHVCESDPIKADLAGELNAQFRKEKIARKTIEYDRLLDMQAVTPYFSRLSVSEVGQKLGADLVVYVVIDRFGLRDSDTSLLWRGKLQVSVRVVDAKTGDRLWPGDRRDDGYAVPAVVLPPVDDSSPNYGEQLCRQLAEKMADRVAKLFYDHAEPEEDAYRSSPDDVIQ